MNTINLLLALLILHFSYSQNTQVLLIENCKVTKQKDTGEFFLCQKRGSCLDDPPPTSGQDCSHYEYNPISEQECRTQCCPSLSKIQILPAEDFQKCCPQLSNKKFLPAQNFTKCCPPLSYGESLPTQDLQKCCPQSVEGKQLSAQDLQKCCPPLRVRFLPASDLQQCLGDWNKKETLYVVTILAAVLGAVAVLVTIALIFIKGFMKNPYTGKLVWVGCCCCAKKIDFSKDRGEIESDERLRRAMTEQKKINLQKVLQYEKSSQ